jgi:transporter family-2 protein
VFGALFIYSQSASVPTIGVALFAVALVSGQNAASLLVDGIGLGPKGRQPVSGYRVASAVMGIVAVVTAVAGRLGGADLSVPLVALCVAAGVGVAFQQATNGRVVASTGEPLVASYVTFAGGALILGLLLAVSSLATDTQLAPLPAWPLWLYLGGIIGALWVAAASWVVGRVGVLSLGLLATAGQLLGALVLDLLLTDVVEVNLVVGVGLALLAVAIAGGPSVVRFRR